jgi:hypothetical protein
MAISWDGLGFLWYEWINLEARSGSQIFHMFLRVLKISIYFLRLVQEWLDIVMLSVCIYYLANDSWLPISQKCLRDCFCLLGLLPIGSMICKLYSDFNYWWPIQSQLLCPRTAAILSSFIGKLDSICNSFWVTKISHWQYKANWYSH